MKRIINILLIFTSFLMLQVACSEDFLSPEPLSFYAPENVYVDKAGFESGMVTVRKDIKKDFYGQRTNLHAEYIASEFGYGIGLTDWTALTPSSGSYFPFLPMFEQIYGNIKNDNVIISRIDDVDWDDQTDRNAILAQALVYRSWWYFRLIMSYGDVPFIGQELTGPKLDFYTHSRWTILEKIIEDLEYAAEWLPETSKAGVPNKYVALNFLAKAYLANTEFDKAVTAATSVINGPYDLMRDRFGSDAGDEELNVLWDLHRPENKSIPSNTESIWTVIDRAEAPAAARQFSYFGRVFHAPFWYGWVLDSEGAHGTADSGPQYRAITRANPDVNQSEWFSYEIWEEGEYTWENTPDLRRSSDNWWETSEILYNNPASVDYGKPIDPSNFAESWQAKRIWPMPYYKTHYPHEPDYTGTPLGGNGDMYIMRLAETYLIRAEAHFWNGDPQSAASDINVVRERANAVPITAADVTIDYIFDERMRELSHEEFRHAELVRASNIMARLGIGGYSLETLHENSFWYDRVQTYNSWIKMGQMGGNFHNTEPRYIYWPIDIRVIATNTLGVINQNKGFDGDQNNVPPRTEITDED